MKENIINNIISVIYLAIALVIFFLRNSFFNALFYAILLLSIVGILKIFLKDRVGFLIIFLSLSFISSMLVFKYKLLPFHKALTFLFFIFLILILSFIMIYAFIMKKKNNKIYDKKCEAIVVDLKRNPNTNKEYYKAVYNYYIDDVCYEVEDLNYKKFGIPNLGDKKILYVDSNDYSKAFFKLDFVKEIFFYLVCMIFIIVSILFVIGLF